MPEATIAKVRRPAMPSPRQAVDGPGWPDDKLIAPVTDAGRGVSEDEYWCRHYADDDHHYEWNRGVLEAKPVPDLAAVLVYGWFMHLLTLFLAVRPVGLLLPVDMGFRLRLPDGVSIRRPDLSVVRVDNPQPLLRHDRSYHGVYDLCVELLSDTKRADIERDTVQKKAEYAAAGVPEHYILHGDPQFLAFYRRTAAGHYVSIAPEDGVIASHVLPGFRFRVSDLFDRPAHATLRGDPVYAEFVYPDWHAVEARAEAEAAARRAAEAELANLRALLAQRATDGN